ncbi:hypothetical protein [Clostridium botulinum]|uniref:hypothetical protein n=1 Tax=Clostridium botulinum TaxID=1491 RepID=UPI001C9BABF5|nr:hypothetical protein [Clostridium botulinum]MBY6838804.1 hypothetical protein [Clostridium botulinum]
MIRYTKKTRDILNFIDKYGFITTRICSNIFYKDSRYGVDMARRTLTKLVNNKDLVSNSLKYGKELVYQFKKETVSDHKYYLLNLYGEINKLVSEVLYFKLEERWDIAQKRSDAHIIFKNKIDGEDIPRSYLIEFDKFHKSELNKYDLIYATGEVQEWYKQNYYQDDYFPDILIINYNGKTNNDSGNFRKIGLDFNFTNLNQKVIL